MSELYTKIEALMKIKGYSLHKLSEVSGVPYTCLSNVKNGRNKGMSAKNLIKLARALDVSIDELTGEKKEPPESDPLTDEGIKLVKSLSEESLTKLIDYARLLLNAEQNQ